MTLTVPPSHPPGQPWAPLNLAETPLAQITPTSITDLWSLLDAGQIDPALARNAAITILRSQRDKWATTTAEAAERKSRIAANKDQEVDADPALLARLTALLPKPPPA